MSINEIQNIGAIKQTLHFVQTDSSMMDLTKSGNLFDDAQQSTEQNGNFLLFPGVNQYDDEFTTQQKNQYNFFI